MKGSEWRYILEVSPWWGGSGERLIQSAKRCLRKCLGKAKLAYEELLVVLTEVECFSAFMLYIYIYEVITPSHLLLGRRLLSSCDDDINQFLNTDIGSGEKIRVPKTYTGAFLESVATRISY